MKVQFQRPEIIDIAPEGEGWKFVVEKRKYDRKYRTSDDCPVPDPDDSNDALENALFLESAVNGDCPVPDPDDSNDALENALFLESAVNGMKLGVRVKCGYRCRGREGFCTKCKDAVALPIFAAAAVNHEANLEIIADTGSEEDLISHSDLEAPYFINPNGQKVQCQLRGNVPVFGDRGPLISCPAATPITKDGTRVAPTSVSNEAGFR
eukprot:s10770_g1.t1